MYTVVPPYLQGICSKPSMNAWSLRWYWTLHTVCSPYQQFLAHLCSVLVLRVVGGGDGRCICGRDIDIETKRIFQTCFNHQKQPPSLKRHQSFIEAVHTTQYPILNSCLSCLLLAFYVINSQMTTNWALVWRRWRTRAQGNSPAPGYEIKENSVLWYWRALCKCLESGGIL